jgi:hypothetical protein
MAQAEPQGDVNEAMDFLRQWGAPWVLTALEGDTKEIQTQTFNADQEKEAAAFINWWMGKRNIYFSVNRPKHALTNKAEKKDIEAVVALHVDVDPALNADINAERKRIHDLLHGYSPPPSIIISSGGGMQGFWLLKEPLLLEEGWAYAEALNRKLEQDLGGDHCHNVDRIMRLPGTLNIPNEKKRKAGRTRARARLAHAEWEHRYEITDFQPAIVETHAKAAPPAGHFPRSAIPEWCERLIAHGNDPRGRYHYDGDRSKAVFAVACALVRCGWSDEEITHELLKPRNAISAHVREQAKPDTYAQRQAEQARRKVGYDFARNEKNKIIADQPNVRLALAKLGVTLSYDTFARRMLIEGPDGKPTRALEDADSDEIHLMLDEMWQFRVAREYFDEIIRNEARHNAFHPVVDYINTLKWDGERRLDTWLSDYAGAVNTDYSRAVGAIILIAAVRRVRQPGCKFDEMVVLESAQGLDKSSGLSTLAVKEAWFTDSLPLNADDKQVIEHLSGRWIAEAPELKGMRKSDVEHLKAFLSRQADRARMSYDRFTAEVPRQCVIFGTTNASTYLRDTTGNRRFWPVRIAKLDVALLRRDRDQLWAEAAAREAAGESIRLPSTLYDAASDEQARRLVDDPWAEIIEHALGIYSTGKIVTSDIWAALDLADGHKTQENNARMGEIMRAQGWERCKLRLKIGKNDSKVCWHYAKGTAEERKIRIVLERHEGQLSVYAWPDGQENPNATKENY